MTCFARPRKSKSAVLVSHEAAPRDRRSGVVPGQDLRWQIGGSRMAGRIHSSTLTIALTDFLAERHPGTLRYMDCGPYKEEQNVREDTLGVWTRQNGSQGYIGVPWRYINCGPDSLPEPCPWESSLDYGFRQRISPCQYSSLLLFSLTVVEFKRTTFPIAKEGKMRKSSSSYNDRSSYILDTISLLLTLMSSTYINPSQTRILSTSLSRPHKDPPHRSP